MPLELWRIAEKLMKEEHYDNVSSFFQELIRERQRRVQGGNPGEFAQAAESPTSPPQPEEKPASYLKNPKRIKKPKPPKEGENSI